ncbi:MAG: hypothetical protein OXB88_04865 [Bacteriovoracales bacterium]|nr:hypothetical protein [Bacteriovoracales bacterium]
MISKKEAREILKDFSFIAEKVSPLLLKRQKSLAKLDIRYKDHQKAQGIVSNADEEAEELILNYLQKKYPSIPALSEEMAHRQKLTDYRRFQKMPLCFVIDPLDGTKNFVHGLDYYCISLALSIFGRPHIGFVLRPPTGESFCAIEGEGSWLKIPPHARRKKLLVKRKNKPLSHCLFSSGLQSPRHRPKVKQTLSIRRMGCAALDLCYVAAERFDGHISEGLSPWDVAGSAVILKEAQIIISDLEGNEFDCFGQTFLAAPQGIYHSLQEALKNRPIIR